MDWSLLTSNYTWLKIVVSALVIGYIQTVIGRNIAFYLHRPLDWYVKTPELLTQPYLKDIGFDLFPDLSGNRGIQLANELCQYLFGVSVAAVAVWPYIKDYLHGGHCQYYTVNIICRLIYAIATGEFLRMAIYLPTSLPGPAPHCRGEVEAMNRPKALSEVFAHPRTAQNCGDLIFSGHMFFATTTACLFWYYLSKTMNPKNAAMGTLLISVIAAIQVICVLLTRSHYSIDITSGIIIGFCQFHVHSYVWRPEEPKVELPIKEPFYVPINGTDDQDRKIEMI